MVIPKKVIAGWGSGSKLRIVDNWHKLMVGWTGMAESSRSDYNLFDIHWYHHKDRGDILFKIKSYTERRK